MKKIFISGVELSNNAPFVLFGGVNVLENEKFTLEVCKVFVDVSSRLKIPLVFKASFDKLNRSRKNLADP